MKEKGQCAQSHGGPAHNATTDIGLRELTDRQKQDDRMIPDTAIPCTLDALPATVPFWLRATGLLAGAMAARAIERGNALPLAGGPLAFAFSEILARRGDVVVTALTSLTQLRRWAATNPSRQLHVTELLQRVSVARPCWAGLSLDRPVVMGIVNVTPDSFSEAGAFADPERAIAHGRALVAAGADIIDVGGESTRPGAAPVTPEEERRRITPVVRALAEQGALVSIDTRHASVMAAALDCGARIVNDVSGLAGDPESPALIARRAVPVVLMHMRGEPQTMQHDPRYQLASLDVAEELATRIAACVAAGIPRERIIVDPGIGFGKTVAHNCEILARLSLFHALGCGVLIGVSRKSFIGRLSGAAVTDRLPGSLAAALQALSQGAQILRVHDVAETRQAVALWQAINAGA